MKGSFFVTGIHRLSLISRFAGMPYGSTMFLREYSNRNKSWRSESYGRVTRVAWG